MGWCQFPACSAQTPPLAWMFWILLWTRLTQTISCYVLHMYEKGKLQKMSGHCERTSAKVGRVRWKMRLIRDRDDARNVEDVDRQVAEESEPQTGGGGVRATDRRSETQTVGGSDVQGRTGSITSGLLPGPLPPAASSSTLSPEMQLIGRICNFCIGDVGPHSSICSPDLLASRQTHTRDTQE